MKREYARVENLDAIDDYRFVQHVVCDESVANLISSKVEGTELHMPAIDIDLPCRLVESRTPGHFHLYIDKPMAWDVYKNLLAAMVNAGIIEDGYYKASLARGATFLRKAALNKAVA